MHIRILLASALLAGATSTFAGVAVTPNPLGFGSVTAGQAKTMSITIKNEGALGVKGSVSVSAPFTLSSSSISLSKLASATINVTLPSTAAPGTHNGHITINAPSLLAGHPPLVVTVPISASVSIPPSTGTGGSGSTATPDLKVGPITLKNCSINQTIRNCSFNVPLTTTGTTIATAKTSIFETRGSDPEFQTLNNQLLMYNPPGANPFIYGLQLPATVPTFKLRIVVDSDSKVAESNEGNNTVIATFNLQ